MGALVDEFGGKINGELIRASDWNGMLAAVEAMVAGVQEAIEAKLPVIEATVAGLDARVTALEGHIDDLVSVASTLRARYRRLTLSTESSRFTIGQRGEIVATVTSFDGTPLALVDAATRPWVDFVTPWGTLLPVPGFTSRSGAGGRTISVQVNAAGEARIRLQADHAATFSEAEQVQVASTMATRIQVAGQEMSVADAFLSSATPTSVTTQPAFQAMSQAYVNAGSTTIRRYLDAYYLERPARIVPGIGPIVESTWTDQLATVMAFVKADADPVSPDGAMAAGSIQVTFRDWVTPWIVHDFFVDLTPVIRDYRQILPGLIRTDLRRSVDDILREVDVRVRDTGVLGGQRQFQGAIEAVRGLDVSPAPFFADTVDAVVSGLSVQRAVTYGQTVTPGAISIGTNPGRAVAGAATKAIGEAGRIGAELATQFQSALGDATRGLREQVKADQQVFQAELLREDGTIALARKEARDVRGALETVNRALSAKADLQFVTDFVRPR